MKTRLPLICFAGALGLLGLVPLLAQSAPRPVVFPDVLPANTVADQFALTTDRQRTYFLNQAGEIWLFDRERKTSTRVAGSGPWDMAVSPARNAIAYTKRGDKATEQFVWLSSLDPKTGLAAGPERRLSSNTGDVPSISPDGSLVAFARDDANGVGQSIVVVPIGGGAERVIAPAVPSSVDHIRWTPDGTAIYFGVNPPVACDPEWSCLPLPRAGERRVATIRRAEVAGGSVSTVATVRSPAPGLSPDGTLIVYGDTSGPRAFGVADREGRKLGTITLPATQAMAGWLDRATLLLRASGMVRRVRSVTLARADKPDTPDKNEPRLLFESGDRITGPLWSPDGKTIAIVRCVAATPCELRLLNPDGTLRQTLPLEDVSAEFAAWSPDQRWVSYVGRAQNQLRLVALELATGRVASLGLATPGAVSWMSDSKSVIVSELKGSDTDRRVSFRRMEITGESKPLREVGLDDWLRVATAIDASTALVASIAERGYRLVPLTGDGPGRRILQDIEASPVQPALSADRQWLAVRRSPGSADSTRMASIELCRADGSQRTTIDLPFFVAPGPTSIAILPGGKELIVTEFIRQDGDPGVYVVTVATKAVRKLFTYPARFARSGGPTIAIGPDGRTLLYTMSEPVPPTISTMDLSVFRQPGRQ
jgi:Tol biopolymer transport system component